MNETILRKKQNKCHKPTTKRQDKQKTWLMRMYLILYTKHWNQNKICYVDYEYYKENPL